MGKKTTLAAINRRKRRDVINATRNLQKSLKEVQDIMQNIKPEEKTGDAEGNAAS